MEKRHPDQRPTERGKKKPVRAQAGQEKGEKEISGSNFHSSAISSSYEKGKNYLKQERERKSPVGNRPSQKEKGGPRIRPSRLKGKGKKRPPPSKKKREKRK